MEDPHPKVGDAHSLLQNTCVQGPLPHVQNLTSQVLLSPHYFSVQSAMGTGPYCTESSMLGR